MTRLLLTILIVLFSFGAALGGTPDYNPNPISTAKLPINQNGIYYHTQISDIISDILNNTYSATGHTHVESDPTVAGAISTHAATEAAHHAKTVSSEIDHDATFNFVANEHIDWTQPESGIIDPSNFTETDPTVAGAISTHAGIADAHYTHGTAAAQNVGTGAGNVVQLDGSGYLPAVDGRNLTNLPSPSITATGFNGNLAVTDDTVQKVAQAFDDYLPAWTDITDMPGGFSDGIDSTGLPNGIILYSDYGTFADFDAACTAGVWAYADTDATLTSQTATLDCLIQFLPGTVWTDGGSNSITFAGQIIAGQDQQIFEGFSTGLTIGLNTPDLFLNWWGPELSPPFDDQPEIQAMLTASKSGHRLWWPPEASLSMGQSAATNKSLELYGRGSTIFVIDGWEDVANYWLLGLRAAITDSSTGESVSIAKGSNHFTKPASMTVAVGDYVRLWDSTTNHSNDAGGQYWGLQGVVLKIEGDEIHVSGHADFAVTIDSFQVYDTLLKPVVDGFRFDTTAMTATLVYNRLIDLVGAYGGRIQNNTFYGSGYASEAAVVHGINNTIENNLCSDFLDLDGLEVGASTGRQGYCFVMDGSENVAQHNLSINAKHHYVLGGTPMSSRNTVINNWMLNDIAAQGLTTLQHSGGGTDQKHKAPVDSHANNHTIIFEGNTIITGGGENIFNIRGVEGKIRNNDVYIGESSLTGYASPVIFWKADDTGFNRTVYFSGNEIVNNSTIDYFIHPSTASYLGMNFFMEPDNVFLGNTIDFPYKPSCDSDYVGRVWYASGSSSTYEICRQTGASTYAWSPALFLTTDAINSGVALNIESDTEAQINLLGAGAGATAAAPFVNFQRAGGSLASPTATPSGAFLGAINVRGRGTTTWDSYRTAMQIVNSEAGAWTDSAMGFGWQFKGRPNGTAAGTTVYLDIQNDGTISISDLSGTYTGGSAYVCVNDAGDLYASESACP